MPFRIRVSTGTAQLTLQLDDNNGYRPESTSDCPVLVDVENLIVRSETSQFPPDEFVRVQVEQDGTVFRSWTI